jgi:hypothetical protein
MKSLWYQFFRRTQGYCILHQRVCKTRRQRLRRTVPLSASSRTLVPVHLKLWDFGWGLYSGDGIQPWQRELIGSPVLAEQDVKSQTWYFNRVCFKLQYHRHGSGFYGSFWVGRIEQTVENVKLGTGWMAGLRISRLAVDFAR